MTILAVLRYALVLYFGIVTSMHFSATVPTRKNIGLSLLFYVFTLALQLFAWRLFGFKLTSQIYPFIVHLPLIAFLTIGFKRPFIVSVSSVFSAYLCCQVPRWVSSFGVILFHSDIAEHLCFIGSVFIVYFVLRRYIAVPAGRLMLQSTQSCLLFGAVPFFYYLFDYATTVYTDLLYSGARIVIQFMPLFIALFYFIFVLLYYNEAKRLEDVQREHDNIHARLREAKVEFASLRTMQEQAVLYRHDMRHHLALISSFAAEGDMEKLKNYLSSAEADIDLLTPTRYCDNETVNLILSSFDKRAKRELVCLHTDVKLPTTLSISDTELCALISNALENAISAAAQVEDENLRSVYIHVLINNGRLLFSTENAYVGKIEMDGALPKSNHTETEHGFGMKSITAIVERHGGLYSIETADSTFVLRLVVPLG